MRLLLFLLSFNVFAVDNVLVINNEHGKVIRGGTYSSAAGNCISINLSSDIVIQNATFIDCWINGVAISNSVNVTIVDSYFERTGGAIYAYQSANIKIINNRSKNTFKRVGSARGQSIVQLNHVYGTDNEITNNYSLDDPAISTREDAINVHESYFSKDYPLKIKGNIILGSGTSVSACGIIAGDGGGSNVQITDNKLYNPGGCGVAAAGGQRITLENNQIYSAMFSYSGIGLYASKKPPTHPALCADIIVKNNTIDWTKFTGLKNSHWVDSVTCSNTQNIGQVNNQNLSGMVLPTF